MSDEPWKDWVGRQEIAYDRIGEAPARALAATLNRSVDLAVDPGAALPAVFNWLYFLKFAPMSEVGPDGHPKRGGFLPPVELPRRMWAGSRCRFGAPIRVGDEAEKISTIRKIEHKSGKAGEMVFVTVHHEIRVGGQTAIEEEQDIVYMGIPETFRLPAPIPLPPCDWREIVAVDPVLLFRFSAVTFNGHRIHYDRSYAMEVEKYPGLVVHGPLQAVLLFDAACRREPNRTPAGFDFRGVRPLFDFDTATVNGRSRDDGATEIYTATGDGAVCMQATMQWA
ncbi:MaoC family dehydratase N-terminal domain-containing protein [uncultured Rhodoblastus sp.]|uniref:FAS1-like dehydratase domain-containing protein n=1 Tax=uncultured Rhodoblastus sp. TaxID=543037 RepID=UPI0025CD853C|nr:MaoC family dehydratase N-terminal domain-containing protein [uncultured Rhodoblastus sp.]